MRCRRTTLHDHDKQWSEDTVGKALYSGVAGARFPPRSKHEGCTNGVSQQCLLTKSRYIEQSTKGYCASLSSPLASPLKASSHLVTTSCCMLGNKWEYSPNVIPMSLCPNRP